ncbi:MAG: nif-specific transcriptional activator NifA [Alphaproteobacteria bacterium]|nr:nif-specific transcriptional activator NifA [Alphaproteobacteria bacterium]
MTTERTSRSDLSLGLFYQVSRMLAGALDVAATLHDVLNLLSSYAAMRRGCVATFGGDGAPVVIAAAGVKPEHLRTRRIVFPHEVARHVQSTGMPICVPDIRAEQMDESAVIDGDPALVSYIAVPIKDGQQTIGILSIYRLWDGAAEIRFDADIEFLAMVGALVGQALRLQAAVAQDRERLLLEQSRLQKELLDREETGRGVIDVSSRRHQQPKGGFVGESAAIRQVVELVRQVAPSMSTVLLRGETGTGKEVFARMIHDWSARKGKPFVKVNCAALSETLLESELFGHERGAFTGAMKDRQGRFELADGGSLFLDEIGEISASFQAKLLRVLQEGEFERVGGVHTHRVNVRLICATNRDLEAEVASGRFRADLYYRISVVPVMLPPLRERPGDIGLLADVFLDRFNRENGRSLKWSSDAKAVLESCAFPGNVRELENCVARVATLVRGTTITLADLTCQRGLCLSQSLWPTPVRDTPITSCGTCARPAVSEPPQRPALPRPEVMEPEDDEMDGLPATSRERLVQAMEKAGWVQAKAARLLGLTPRQIGYALKKHNIPLQRL